MEICGILNLLGITVIIVLLAVLIIRKKEAYCLTEKTRRKLLGAASEKTFVLSPNGSTGTQHFYVSDQSPNVYALVDSSVPSWIEGNNNIAISNVKPNSTFIEGILSKAGILYFGTMQFAVPRYAGTPNILAESIKMIGSGPIYLYPLYN